MKVWIENPFDNLPSEGYRPQRYYLMAEAFAKAGHEVKYWTSDYSHSRKKCREVQGELFSSNIDIKLVPTRPYKKNVSIERVLSHREYAREWERMALKESEESSAPDIIIASMPTLSAGCAALRLKKKTSSFFVADIMDAWPKTFKRLLPRPLKWLYKPLFAPLQREFCSICKGADLVTGVSVQYAKDVIAAGAKTYFKTYHGIRLANEVLRKSPSENIKLVYIGGIGRTYDLATIVSALSELPKCTLTIAGTGPEVAKLKLLAENLGVLNRLILPGYLTQMKLEELLASSHIAVLPMTSESCVGVPYKLADYAAAALPVVSSLEGESLDLLNKYSAGLQYVPGDIRSFADAVKSLANDITAYSAAALRMAHEEFDADKIYPHYVSKVVGAKLGAQNSHG